MRRSTRIVPALTAVILAASTTGALATDTTTPGGSTPAASETTVAGASGGLKELLDVVKGDKLVGKEGSGLTRGITDTSIKIGCVSHLANYAGIDDGIKARVKRLNDAGGVNGRKIEFGGCLDSGGNPETIQSLYKQLVEQDQVFAILTLDATTPSAAFDYLSENEVPYIGWGYLPGYCAHRWGFGWNGCTSATMLTHLVPHYAGAMTLVKQTLDAAKLNPAETKVYIQLDDGPAGKGSAETFKTSAEAAGATVVGVATDIPVSAPPSDFTPFTQKAIDSGANLVIVATPFAMAPGYTATLVGSGFKGATLNYVAYVPGLLAQVPQMAQALNGAYVSTQVVPQEMQTPFVKQMETDLESAGAKNGKFITLGGGIGYYEMDLLANLIGAAGKDLNTKTFDQAVNVTGFTSKVGFDGGIGDTMWPQHHFLPTDCAAVVKIEGDKYTLATPFACDNGFRIR